MGGAVGVFVRAAPYVGLDWSSASGSLASMGAEHLLSDAHEGEGFSLWHHVSHNLRYGVGLAGLAGLLAGVVWSAVHGVATLWAQGAFQGAVPGASFDATLDTTLEIVLSGTPSLSPEVPPDGTNPSGETS